jgi:hypothetical protein
MREYDELFYENAASRGLRSESRDSLFILADLSVLGGVGVESVRIRNLSPSGLLAEAATTYAIGTIVMLSFKTMSPVQGRVVWVLDGRMGIKLDEEIDPLLARLPIGHASDEIPDHIRIIRSKRPRLKSGQ